MKRVRVGFRQHHSDHSQSGREVLGRPVRLLSGVDRVLPRLKPHYKLIVITKGDLLDQERKLSASGLLPYFHHIEVVTEKQVSNYSRLLEILDVRPHEFMMVGNSLRSDIAPVLALGAKAVHIPQPEVWAHENATIPDHTYITLKSMDDLPGVLNDFPDLLDGLPGALDGAVDFLDGHPGA